MLGECFLFSIQPKMAVFHSTGKDENFQMLTGDQLAMGGQPGQFLLFTFLPSWQYFTSNYRKLRADAQ